jgi:hypothetical protein
MERSVLSGEYGWAMRPAEFPLDEVGDLKGLSGVAAWWLE